MFSGIGSGVGGLGVSSPITSAAPGGMFTNASLAKRNDDTETVDSAAETGGKTKGRRRKLKDDDSRDDDSSGRLTPGTKAKRAKGHPHHHHQYVASALFGRFDDHISAIADIIPSHHHHHHHRLEDGPQGATPFKNVKGVISNPSPTEKAFAAGQHHHHHHHGGRSSQTPQIQTPKQPTQSPAPVMPAKTKTVVMSQAVIDSVAKNPRHHLGDFIYESELKPSRLLPSTPAHRGFASNPKPLPWDLIKGKLNCTLTVKIPRIYLSPLSREEITSRGFLWGTDIYTDDSDVIAACIHSGWIRGEWADDVDSSMFEIEPEEKRRKGKDSAAQTVDTESEGLITAPPASGPMAVPADRDLHVNVLILPRLAKYGAMTRFGITSREFGGEHGNRNTSHDGLSFKIHNIRWVENGAQPQARLRGKARRERMRKAMSEVKGTFGNVASVERPHDKRIPGNWWRNGSAKESGAEETDVERPASEGDKENQLAGDEAAPAKEKETGAPDAQDVEMSDVTPALAESTNEQAK